MTTEELIERLCRADELFGKAGMAGDGPTRLAIAEAIRQLTPKPEEPGSVEVRIACLVTKSGHRDAIPIQSGEDDDRCICFLQSGWQNITHGPDIIVARLSPARSAQVVEGKVAQ